IRFLICLTSDLRLQIRGRQRVILALGLHAPLGSDDAGVGLLWLLGRGYERNIERVTVQRAAAPVLARGMPGELEAVDPRGLGRDRLELCHQRLAREHSLPVSRPGVAI